MIRKRVIRSSSRCLKSCYSLSCLPAFLPASLHSCICTTEGRVKATTNIGKERQVFNILYSAAVERSFVLLTIYCANIEASQSKRKRSARRGNISEFIGLNMQPFFMEIIVHAIGHTKRETEALCYVYVQMSCTIFI